jgi:hypothetical protein
MLEDPRTAPEWFGALVIDETGDPPGAPWPGTRRGYRSPKRKGVRGAQTDRQQHHVAGRLLRRTGQNVMYLFAYRLGAYPEDDSFDAYNAERLRSADTLLVGRTSYKGFKSYWPPVADDPDAPPVAREISRLNNAIVKVVVSDTLKAEETKPWANTRIVRRGLPRADRRTQGPSRQRRPDLRQPYALERPAGSRPGRRTAPDDRSHRARRGNADVRRAAAGRVSARRDPHVGGLGERAPAL